MFVPLNGNMFGIFKKRTPLQKLEKNYKILIEEAYRLSHTDRSASDAKTVEANKVLMQIAKLKES